MLKSLRGEQGFTLIELMVVVLIIGILVAIAVPVFINASNSAKDKTCKANLRTLDGAIQTFGATNQTDPTSLSDLVPSYIKELPKCPHNNTAGESNSGYSFVPAVTGVSPAVSKSEYGTTYP